MSNTVSSPTETVEAFLEAFAAMDFDRALTHLADDAQYTNIPVGTVRGHVGVRDDLTTAGRIHDSSLA